MAPAVFTAAPTQLGADKTRIDAEMATNVFARKDPPVVVSEKPTLGFTELALSRGTFDVAKADETIHRIL